jgi:hypothetical protein
MLDHVLKPERVANAGENSEEERNFDHFDDAYQPAWGGMSLEVDS